MYLGGEYFDRTTKILTPGRFQVDASETSEPQQLCEFPIRKQSVYSIVPAPSVLYAFLSWSTR